MHMGFGCKPYTNAKCKLSWQFLSNCKDLNDLLTVYLKQGNLQERSRNMNQELHYMFWEWNQQRRTKKKSAREPAWIKSPVTVIHCFILFSLSLFALRLPTAAPPHSFLSSIAVSERWTAAIWERVERTAWLKSMRKWYRKYTAISEISCSGGHNASAVKYFPSPFTINTSHYKNTATMLCQVKC